MLLRATIPFMPQRAWTSCMLKAFLEKVSSSPSSIQASITAILLYAIYPTPSPSKTQPLLTFEV
jgi:hypothetical protein